MENIKLRIYPNFLSKIFEGELTEELEKFGKHPSDTDLWDLISTGNIIRNQLSERNVDEELNTTYISGFKLIENV